MVYSQPNFPTIFVILGFVLLSFIPPDIPNLTSTSHHHPISNIHHTHLSFIPVLSQSHNTHHPLPQHTQPPFFYPQPTLHLPLCFPLPQPQHSLSHSHSINIFSPFKTSSPYLRYFRISLILYALPGREEEESWVGGGIGTLLILVGGGREFRIKGRGGGRRVMRLGLNGTEFAEMGGEDGVVFVEVEF